MTLVFLHGAGCTPSIFAAQLDAFPGSIALALPGHGTVGAARSIDEFAAAVAADMTARNLHDTIVCGFSMGGAIALMLALQRNPRIRALALLGSGSRLRVPQATIDGLTADFEQTARGIAHALYADATSERIENAVAMMRIVGPEQCARDFSACNAFDVTERLSEIAIPAVAITGEQDVMTPPKYATYLADRIPGASARILPRTGHLAVVESPADVNEALRAFVTRIS